MKLTRRWLILLTLVVITVIAGYRGLLGNGATAGACGTCGDGYCVPMCGETAANCPADCGLIER